MLAGSAALKHVPSARQSARLLCANCGDHVYPTAGTVFEDTRTPLQLWFYAIYLFVTTRHGVWGKELQRALGVTYKTAWRMGQQIRSSSQNADPADLLQGHVEVDEAYVGGVRSGGKRGRGAPGKTIVMGMKERGGACSRGDPEREEGDASRCGSAQRRARLYRLDRRTHVLWLTHR